MGYAAGSPSGTTGVGSSENATGQSQQPGFGGKGGGMGAAPQSLAQPNQSSSAPANKPAPVFGGNAFGYNMNRLASRMDPSASLPQQQPEQQQQQQQNQAPAAQGGKGGGYGELPGAQEFLSQFGGFGGYEDPYGNYGMQQPNNQYSSPYEATDKFGAPTTSAETEKTAVNNPYEMQMKTMQQDFDQRMKDLEARYGASSTPDENAFAEKETAPNPYEEKYNDLQRQLDEMKAAKTAATTAETTAAKDEIETIEDTGAEVSKLGEEYDDIHKTTTLSEANKKAEADKLAADAKAKAEADRLATIPEWQTDKAYTYKTYANFKPEDLVGMSANEIKSLYANQKTQADADVKKADADYKAAMASGDPKRIAGARANLNAQKEELNKIKADQATANKSLTGTNKTYETSEAKAARDATTKAAADKAAADKKAIADKKTADAKAAADKKKADAAQKIADAKAVADKKKADDKAKADAAAAKAAENETKKRAEAAEKKRQADLANDRKRAEAADKQAIADAKKAKDKADADAKKAADKAKADAKKAEDKAKADAKKAAKTPTTRKAQGGIIHKGMSNKLKKMLGE
jgi:hypothetical protein